MRRLARRLARRLRLLPLPERSVVPVWAEAIGVNLAIFSASCVVNLCLCLTNPMMRPARWAAIRAGLASSHPTKNVGDWLTASGVGEEHRTAAGAVGVDGQPRASARDVELQFLDLRLGRYQVARHQEALTRASKPSRRPVEILAAAFLRDG